MNVRVMADGKPFGSTDCRTVRKAHRPVPADDAPWTCVECREHWYWANRADGGRVRRHYPGTFWVDDSDRSRW